MNDDMPGANMDELRHAIRAVGERRAMPDPQMIMSSANRRRRRALAIGGVVVITAATSTGIALSAQGGMQLAGPEGAGLSREATIRCTADGTVVSPSTIAASADGVHVLVLDDTNDPTTYLNLPTEGDPAPATLTPRVLTHAPGQIEMYCSHSGGTDRRTEDEPVTLWVLDPDGFYTTVNTKAILGCDANSYQSEGPTATGATANDAALNLGAAYDADRELINGSGYAEQPNRQYLLRGERLRAVIETYPLGEGFEATIQHTCGGPIIE